jgi:tetratricopeptide (TPR) repeat protein
MLKVMQGKLLPNSRLLAIVAMLVMIASCNQAFTQAPDEDYLSGCASVLKGDYGKAVESFSSAILHNNADERLFIKRGESLLNLKDFEGALNDFMEANAIYPGVADLWLARCYALSGDTENAITFLTSHLKSEFRLPADSIKKDLVFDQLQTTPEWYTLWQHEWYNEEEKVVAEFQYFRKKKLFEEAGALLTSEMNKSSENKVLFALRGKLSLDQENYAASIVDFSTALNLDRNFMTVYPQRAVAYYKAGRFKDAVSDFTKAIRNDPAGFHLYLQRAEAYAGMQSWEPAIKDMLFYLKYFESNQQALHQCGEYYYESGDYINALKCFNRNLKDDSNNSNYYKSRGKTYLKTATYRYAISDLSMSLDLNPDDAETWMFLGIAKLQSGDRENGCSDLEKARKMGESRSLKYIIENCQ